ncbi:DHA2 family efflux MFS transporter permease subunit [Paenibacillus sp. HB172176]|uniref:DHA2 family efflux MFS transporter permease subunit n=1 Tax=Paenibacillus sp. HB172176 TaxID=2493690 RepID=UPI00143C5602|nr:DHA2 family efflux MFS transporter permease subunit [Paenibacillus sp. HB172176]
MSEVDAVEKSVGKRWWALGAVCLGLFMALLDVTIVNVALPAIQSDLQTDFSELEWVVNAYTLVFAVALVTTSRLGDIFGRKTLFMLGMVVFTIGSLLCGLSHDIMMLNLSRGVQGLGASAMTPLSLAIISATFSGKQRGIAIGIWGGVSGLATGIGPVIGGLLVKHIGWQSIFYLNIPVGIIAVLLSIWAIKQSKDESAARKIDLFGFVTFTVFMFCLIYGLIQFSQEGNDWRSLQVWLLFGISALALVIFVAGELRVKHPMADPRLFKIPSFTGSAIAAFCLSAGMYALLFNLTLYLQSFLGLDSLETGVKLIAFTAMALLFGPLSGALMGKVSLKWLVVVSMVLMAIGVYAMSFLSHHHDPAKWIVLLPGFIIAGIGSGLINPPISNLAVGTVPLQRAGMASGMSNVARQMGSAFGIAFFGAILSSRYTTLVADRVQSLTDNRIDQSVKEQVIQTIESAGPIAGSNGLAGMERTPLFQDNPLFDTYREITRASFVDGTIDIIRIASVILAIGAVLCMVLIRKKDLQH